LELLELLSRLFDNQPVLTVLRNQPVLALFVILGLGYMIGNIRIASISLGPVAGVLFVGLFFGHFGFRINPGAQMLGFALFIFSVGYQAGPRFFDVLMKDGLKYFVLAVTIATIGFTMAAVLSTQLDLKPGTSAGLLAGGLTSSPTLAAAQEALRSGSISAPAGWTTDDVIGNITTGYAITYIFGLVGLILIIKLLPGILGVNLEEEAQKVESADTKAGTLKIPDIVTRTYRVTKEESTKQTVGEARKKHWDRFSVVRTRRDGEVKRLDLDDHLRLGDEVLVMGDAELFTQGIPLPGEEIVDPDNVFADRETADIVAVKSGVIGKTLEELNIADNFALVVTRIRRMGIDIARSADFHLRKGDVITVTGLSQNIDRLSESMGAVERDGAETDMVTFSLGIGVGVLLGLISIKVGTISIALGSAGGLLSAGIIVGFINSIRPTFGRLPAAARWIFMEFGLLLFMAGVGMRAGGDIIETFLQAGPKLVLAGILVTTVPVLAGYFLGRKVLRINPALLLGAVTGSMTSGAALSVVTKAANSSVPALGYTGAYAFANVLLTIAGSIILLL
jgi:putative transport protein